MFKATILFVLAVALALPSLAAAQMLGTYGTIMDRYQDRCIVDAAVVTTGDGMCPDNLTVMPTRPVAPWPAGAVTTNNHDGVILATNGVTDIVRVYHPLRNGLSKPLPSLPLPTGYGPLHPVSGMTMDADTGLIYLMGGNPTGDYLTVHDPAAGMASVAPPFANLSSLNQIVGIDLDECHGWILVVDPFGDVAWCSLTAAGMVVEALRPWPFPIPSGVYATGVAIDRSSSAPCVPGSCSPYYVSWTDGTVIHGFSGLMTPGLLHSKGLTYTAVPIRLPSPGSPTGTDLQARVSDYLREGHATDLLLSGVPAGISAAFLGVSLGYVPGGITGPAGEVLWLAPPLVFNPPLVFPVSSTGRVTVPLGPLPYPHVAYVQWAIDYPAGMGGAGLELSNALNFEVSRL